MSLKPYMGYAVDLTRINGTEFSLMQNFGLTESELRAVFVWRFNHQTNYRNF
jgi:hypothetical protein